MIILQLFYDYLAIPYAEVKVLTSSHSMELLRNPGKLAAACSSIPLPTQFLATIDGKEVSGVLPSFGVENPANGLVFAQSPSCSESQLDEAAAAAKRALSPWNNLGEKKRKQLMSQVAKKLAQPENFLLLGKVLCLEQGKKLADAVGEGNV